MRVLKDVAERLSCFVLGVDHYGKNMDAGLKGSVAKETQGDLVLVCLGERERSGRVVNTRLAVRKCRGGVQGKEFPFTTRVVEHPEKDEDGEAITTLVIDWQPVPPGGAQPQAEPDPWAQGRRQEQRTAALRLKRVLMGILADQGVELPIPPDGPVVRMVAQKIVQKEFYTHTRRPMDRLNRSARSDISSSAGLWHGLKTSRSKSLPIAGVRAPTSDGERP